MRVKIFCYDEVVVSVAKRKEFTNIVVPVRNTNGENVNDSKIFCSYRSSDYFDGNRRDTFHRGELKRVVNENGHASAQTVGAILLEDMVVFEPN